MNIATRLSFASCVSASFWSWVFRAIAAVPMIGMACIAARAQDSQCAARLIRAKPSVLRSVTSETLKACISGQTNAAVEDAGIRVGRFGALQGTISISNRHNEKTIKRVEWKLDAYDEQRRSLHDTLYLFEDKKIEPNKTKGASQYLSVADTAKKVLPTFAVILVQVSKITYIDGSVYIPTVECKMNETFDDATCTTRKVN